MINFSLPEWLNHYLPDQMHIQTWIVLFICFFELIFFVIVRNMMIVVVENVDKNQTLIIDDHGGGIYGPYRWLLTVLCLIGTQMYWAFQTQQFANGGYHRIAWLFGPLFPIFILIVICQRSEN